MKNVEKYIGLASTVLTAGRELVREFKKPKDPPVDPDVAKLLTGLVEHCAALEEENKKLRAKIRALGGTLE